MLICDVSRKLRFGSTAGNAYSFSAQILIEEQSPESRVRGRSVKSISPYLCGLHDWIQSVCVQVWRVCRSLLPIVEGGVQLDFFAIFVTSR